MNIRSVRPVAILAATILSGLSLVACGGSSKSKTSSTGNKSGSGVRVIAAAAALRSAGPPQPNGVIWTLSGDGGVRTLSELNLSSGKPQQAVGASADAISVTQSSSGVIALGLGSVRTGAVQILDSNAKPKYTIPLSDPAVEVEFGDNGTTLYALQKRDKVASVAVINSATRKITKSVPVSSAVVSFAVDPNQDSIWTLDRAGVIDSISLQTDRVQSSFSLHVAGVAIAASPDGAQLFVLRKDDGGDSISVVKSATEAQTNVLPAAANSVGLVVSLDGTQLYNLVGTAQYGNIQVISL